MQQAMNVGEDPALAKAVTAIDAPKARKTKPVVASTAASKSSFIGRMQ
jgi:hypothetical protein